MLLNILTFPHPNLRKVAAPVERFDAALKKLTQDMIETMYHAKGIGLAAIQVNIAKRVVVMDISEQSNSAMVFINPEFTVIDKTLQSHKEGCLSVPSFFDEVSRPREVELTYKDVAGKPYTIVPEGLLSVCIQHEIDHLNGKLFVDYLSSLKRERIRKQLLKTASK